MVLGFTGFSGSLSFVVVSPEEILSARDFSGITAICVSLSPMESVSDRVRLFVLASLLLLCRQRCLPSPGPSLRV